jgi:hypothetical protein
MAQIHFNTGFLDTLCVEDPARPGAYKSEDDVLITLACPRFEDCLHGDVP